MQLGKIHFEDLVRDALARLYEPEALQTDPALYRRVSTAIEEMKPGANVKPNAKAWRPYRVLHLRYVEGLNATEVQQALALSKSQYYREHESAVQALVALLSSAEPISRLIAAPRSNLARRGLAAGGALTVFALLALFFARGALEADANRTARELVPEPPPAQLAAPSLRIYAGTGQPGYENGPGAFARFAGPFGLAVDSAGIVYVADTGNHRVRKIMPTGLVLDVAGSGTAGYADGPGAAAQFNSPNAVTVGPDGTVYVGDIGNLRIRAISPLGVVSTLAGSGNAGYRDGVGGEAEFGATGTVVADQAGNVYVTDRPNNVIRKVTPAGAVTTHSGTGVRGHTDGPPGVAQFNGPQRGGCVDRAGNFYVLDTVDNRIRRVAPDGSVTTVAGTGTPGYADGPAAEALFSAEIRGMCADPAGSLYVMDAGNRRVRVVSAAGMVSTLYEFTAPNQTPGNLKLDLAGNLYLSDREHNVIYKLTLPPRIP